MFNRKTILVFSLACLFLLIYQGSWATTDCKQTLTFFALTRGESALWTSAEEGNLTFWISEDISGECVWSHLIQISISAGKVSACYTSLMGYEEWDWLKEGIKHFQKEHTEELVENNGVWYCSTASFYVKPPISDSALSNSFSVAYREGREREWTRSHRFEGICMPVFQGIKTELVHYHEAGLYSDYQISKAYYFPYSKYLLIFIHQPHLASGLDTMHGFLIFRTHK